MTSPSNSSTFGRAGWIAGLVVTNVVTFVGTLLFAQSVWDYNTNVAAAGTTAGASATGPATGPSTTQAAAAQTSSSDGGGGEAMQVNASMMAARADEARLAELVTMLQADAGDGSYDHAAFDAILGEVVSNELVDYAAVRDEHADALDGYLDGLATMSPDALAGLSDDAQLALLINLYNAEMVDTVAERYEPGYSVSADGFAVFDEPLVTLAGDTFSLNDLEHRIIRPAFEEPGIHAALVCAALSCPPLIPDAYAGATVRQTLEGNVQAWLDGPRNEVDHDARTLRLSSIFDWYGEDFAGGDVAAYIDGYVEQDVSGYDVEFLDYDWTLNDAG